jgi:hypothetical protein
MKTTLEVNGLHDDIHEDTLASNPFQPKHSDEV